MSDTIYRQAAIDACHRDYDTILDFTSNGKTIADSFEDILNALPPAQPQRMHGRWIGYNTEKEGWKRTDGSPVFMSCSECHGTVLNNGSGYWNYCPKCGHDMREEADNDSQRIDE